MGGMIKALFNKVPTGVSLDVSATDNSMTFKADSDWWNAAYYIREGNMDNKYTVYTESEADFLKSIEDSVKEENLDGKNKVTKTKFKVYREVSGKTDTFEIGDRIKIKINGEKHFATAIQQKGDMTLFVLDDCLDYPNSMKCEGKLCYEGSRTRSFLKDCKVSKKYRNYLVSAGEWYRSDTSFSTLWEDDKLFLLSINEVSSWCRDLQLAWFRGDWKNRIACRRNKCETWWLRTTDSTDRYFHSISVDGCIIYTNVEVDSYIGVRPAFVLRTEGSHEQ